MERKHNIWVRGKRIAYVDRGYGDPAVFLHGNPTSSFLWRNILTPVAKHARVIAPDLIGMGDSAKLQPSGPESYSYFEHLAYLEDFFDGLRLERPVVLVVHDWGSALGFEWARRHPDRVRAIVYMEAIVGVMRWSEWAPAPRALFQALRSPDGDRMVLEDNVFVEKVLPGSVIRTLSDEEHDEYRRPFRERGEARRPTLSWPRQLPIDGEPAEICALVERYASWLATTEIPKLFVNAEPGRILTGRLRDECRRWRNQREISVRGLHYVQEDSPGEIAGAIIDFIQGVSR